MPYSNFGKFVIFISIISFATAIASPFFAVYMLKDLDMSILSYTIITVGSALTSLLFLPVWGNLSIPAILVSRQISTQFSNKSKVESEMLIFVNINQRNHSSEPPKTSPNT